ncbi:plasmid SOS inhibition protein A [Escherichia coli]|uniref:plasmid SOS inhibition protein A n=1 Tax=Escherichia coli TaxID=562 RepID=UPI0023F9C4D6|nr:plasmid SOS inhibition protein A [Escherichia coli]MDF7604801.1 plasmid SOS inhibition protein A [Escherichia coli]MDF7620030.1 plasmid SOS inhibition protein A [Escherichia coli]
MIPNSLALVTLKPARQAALQAILDVETRRSEGRRLPELPYVRTFLRILTGSSRINTEVARRIPGLNWVPGNRLVSLKQVEAALEILLAGHGENCPLPLPVDMQGEFFPERVHNQTGRKRHRREVGATRSLRRETRLIEQVCLQRQNLLARAVTELNFCSPETVQAWYARWSDEFGEELAAPFWRWQSRFRSLEELEWNRLSHDPLWQVMHDLQFIVRETPEGMHRAERWQVPNKLRYQPVAGV